MPETQELRKEYTIDGHEVYQEKLSIGGALATKRLLNKVGFKKGLDFYDAVDLLEKKNKLNEFILIILKGDLPKKPVTEWPAEIGLAIISDFFLFNDVLIKALLISWNKENDSPSENEKSPS